MPVKRTLEKRFWDKVQVVPDGCWLWSASVSRTGYGKFRVMGDAVSHVPAHRVSWELTYGHIPEGMCVLHRCDVPGCVRPDHLFLGSNQDNMDDMLAKGRRYTKVSADDVREMRRRRESGETFASLARRFKISTASAYKIATGKSRREIV